MPNGWTDKPVEDEVIHQLSELSKWDPTASNTCSARFVWVRSPEAKTRLASVVFPPNKPKIQAAPLGHHRLRPCLRAGVAKAALSQASSRSAGNTEGARGDDPEHGHAKWKFVGSLPDTCGACLGTGLLPMSGFDNIGVDREFLIGTSIQSNLLCSLGYGNPELVHPRGPRLTFDEAAVRLSGREKSALLKV